MTDRQRRRRTRRLWEQVSAAVTLAAAFTLEPLMAMGPTALSVALQPPVLALIVVGLLALAVGRLVVGLGRRWWPR